jgi:hypothetical protein
MGCAADHTLALGKAITTSTATMAVPFPPVAAITPHVEHLFKRLRGTIAGPMMVFAAKYGFRAPLQGKSR